MKVGTKWGQIGYKTGICWVPGLPWFTHMHAFSEACFVKHSAKEHTGQGKEREGICQTEDNYQKDKVIWNPRRTR